MCILELSELLFPKKMEVIPRLDLHIRAVWGGPEQRRKKNVIYYYAQQRSGVFKYIGYTYVDRLGRLVKSIGIVEFCKQNGLWPEK